MKIREMSEKFNSKDKTVGSSLVGAPACGDVMKLQVKIEDDVIVDAKFKTFGLWFSYCVIIVSDRMGERKKQLMKQLKLQIKI